jgi:hypothetical protein
MKSLPRSPRFFWWIMVLVAVSYFGFFVFFPQLLKYVAINHFDIWFLDALALLTSNDAVAHGLNPYVPNPLDPLGRPHVYTHWWLGLGQFGLGRQHIFWFGLVQVVAFFLAAVADLHPRSWRETAWYLAILCSSPVLLAINRANNDIVVFLLLFPVVPCLLDHRRIMRLFPCFLLAVATGLKFYPAVAGLVLLAGSETREVRVRLTIAVLLLAIVAIDLVPDLQRMKGLVPRADGLMSFAAMNVFQMVGLKGWHVIAGIAGALVAIVMIFLRWTPLREWKVTPQHQGDWLRFILGTVLLTGCFFSGTNYAYRWVFALWLAPLLWRLINEPDVPAASRRFARVTAIMLVIALWADPVFAVVIHQWMGVAQLDRILHWANVFFVIEQPFTWCFFICLLGWLTHFVRQNLGAVFRTR